MFAMALCPHKFDSVGDKDETAAAATVAVLTLVLCLACTIYDYYSSHVTQEYKTSTKTNSFITDIL
jgi:ABC-type Fe3+ transport system permease subunit